jgi:hypothetical protein
MSEPSVMPRNVRETNQTFRLRVENPLCTAAPNTVVPT